MQHTYCCEVYSYSQAISDANLLCSVLALMTTPGAQYVGEGGGRGVQATVSSMS